jgi:hypothetical protein
MWPGKWMTATFCQLTMSPSFLNLVIHAFTREPEMVNYYKESFRVLKPGGSMAMYCFSMDHPPPTFGDRHTFRFGIGNSHVESMAVPEAAVAYEEAFLFKVANETGFRSAEMMFAPDDWQPMLLCRK